MKKMYIKRKYHINEVKFIPWTDYLNKILEKDCNIINKLKDQTKVLYSIASLICTK